MGTLSQRGAARKTDFILPPAAGNRKSLADSCPGAGCGSAPVCGGPCKRCCPPLAEKWVKKWPSSGAFPVRSQCSVIRSSEGRQTQGGCLPFGGGRGKQRKPRKGRSPLDGAQWRKNGGLLHLAIRRSASQSTHTWLLDHIRVHFVPEKIFQLLNSQI